MLYQTKLRSCIAPCRILMPHPFWVNLIEPRQPISRVLYRAARWFTFHRSGTSSQAKDTVATIYLAPTLPPGSSGQPGDGPGIPKPPIRPCSRWGLPCP